MKDHCSDLNAVRITGKPDKAASALTKVETLLTQGRSINWQLFQRYHARVLDVILDHPSTRDRRARLYSALTPSSKNLFASAR